MVGRFKNFNDSFPIQPRIAQDLKNIEILNYYNKKYRDLNYMRMLTGMYLDIVY